MNSCNCGSGNHFHEHKGITHGHERINHVFDPNPPAFYGTWHHLYGYNPGDRVSMTQPGIETGLYRNNGSLHCNPCRGNITMLTGVETLAKITLLMKFNYSNSNCNNIVEVVPGKVYTVKYLENGTIKGNTGLVTNIYKVYQLNEEQEIYKIRFDCSANYNNNVIVVKSDQIREIKEYIPYQDEEIIIQKANHNYGTTLARVITDAIVIDAQLDENKNIIKGTIIEGNITDGRTIDGIITGTNPAGHEIVVRYGQTAGGKITGGTIVSGRVRQGEITNGTVNEETGMTTSATIKGTITECMISTSMVSEASTVEMDQARIIDPTIKDGRLVDAILTGGDMITKGGITIGNITTDGVTIGGNASGGIAVGYIDNEYYNMVNGTTTAINNTPYTEQEIENFINGRGTNTKDGILNTGITGIDTTGRLITQGGVLVGGTVIGGIKMGSATYGAIIKGGTVTGGITIGGITTGGTLIPKALDGIYNNGTRYNPEADEFIKNHPEIVKDPTRWYSEDLLLMTDIATHTEFYTNFGTAIMERVKGRVRF